ncbi:HAD family hydrolase [Caldithrix abyssi]|uniref:HAD-superfamily hydrolase, subfamily IA, variant 3 n=1 Tax=Caldithrix abyssi DSM 13497 TaxID=880073 RepID=H1XYQ0_CALAY|nr:HAD family phosphatase [Caldithrix abyssi]APF20570.1 putative hydrolase of the HAD superfamily [Caldithrix abyssi DSM 13497]EHO40919.1 HAD-superfamily hydrolase, subfamily IA, variant 3 [Caldithrix abyssi DSM 13497]
MAEIKAIIFDLGRVLVDVKFNQQTAKFFGVDTDHPEDAAKILDAAFNNELFRKLNRGEISSYDFYEAFSRDFNLNLSYQRFVDYWVDVFAPIPGMEDLFWQVKKRYPVGLLSDTDELHWNYCREKFPFIKSVEKPTLSFEIGALKPDKKCYLKAAENVGFAPEVCLFIDDREVNVQGAKKAGMQAVLFEGVEKLKGDFKKLGIEV